MIDKSIGKLQNLTIEEYTDQINQMFDFWRFLRISEERFLKTADIGDIILCLHKKKYTLKNRMDAIDQVCLIVRLDDEQDAFNNFKSRPNGKVKSRIYVIRTGSNIDQGVILQSWEDFRIYKSLRFSECQFRHLYCERSKEFVKMTQRFIQNVKDKPFYENPNTKDVEP